ncbi:MAG: ammonium transporter, partial [Methylococcus sp.]|nr:ammonium transporter [Methylococcus sp.]
GISLISQVLGTGLGIAIALAGGFAVYGSLKMLIGLRLTPEEEFEGADLTLHQISASPEKEAGW